GGAVGLALGAGGALAATTGQDEPVTASPADRTYEFTGAHQAGIVTPAQDRMHFAAFDLRAGTSRQDVRALLEDWTRAAARLVLGGEVSARGAFGGGQTFPPEDTGEAAGLGPSGLTLTFGLGRSLFRTEAGTDRYGLARGLPEHFTELPVMVNDFLDPARSGGDLCIQACAGDPQVAVHAIRNLTRIAVGRAALRWSQLGFGRTSSTSTAQSTPRNLFGLKDGTNNLKAEQREMIDEHVWIGADQGPAWAVGGSYLIARRIAMTIEVWDSLQLGEQERVTGRDKPRGAPLSGGEEFTAPDFSATDGHGRPLIDERSHVFRTHPDHNDGIRMLRRGYNFVDGNDAQGRLDAGLFFIAFVNAPARFARVHTSMARDDLFTEYLKTTGSAVFLVPPGLRQGEFVGQGLFEATG
ncbi:MAG TPA: iron uptake transporter deferrochelatase/peroxidase subunit, partial [Citricoccus sp.]